MPAPARLDCLAVVAGQPFKWLPPGDGMHQPRDDAATQAVAQRHLQTILGNSSSGIFSHGTSLRIS